MSPISYLNLENTDAVNRVTVIRPLLDVSKGEILEFLKEKGVDYRFDRTNLDMHLLRNWMRGDLIPQLEARIDPQLSMRLAQQAQILRDEEIILEGATKVELDRIRNATGLCGDLLVKQNRAMQRRIVRRWIEESRGHLRGIDFGHVEEFLNLIAQGPPQGRLSIPGGWQLIKEYETLRLKKPSKDTTRHCYSYEFRIGSELNVREAGMTIHSERIVAPFSERPTSLLQAAFDIAALPETLTIRNFRRGDRFRPLGMTGHKKVKELFIEKKVPLSVRSTLPLLSMGEEILWIPGYGRSEFGKVGANTQKILYLRAVTLDC